MFPDSIAHLERLGQTAGVLSGLRVKFLQERGEGIRIILKTEVECLVGMRISDRKL